MLARLAVSNLAIVESAEVEFGEGLNIVTGETGAGKSVLMGALALVLGARADATAVRDGAKEARVEAAFSIAGEPAKAVAAVLSERGLPACEDGSLLVRRTVSASGGGRAWVNDAPATVQTLRALGERLVDVHGPDDNRTLLDDARQRALLDACGGIDSSDYAAAWRELSRLRAARARLEADSESGVAAECEALRYAVEELDAANLTAEDEDELPARHAAAAHAADLLSGADAATAALAGDDGETPSAAAALISAGAYLADMARHYEPASAWREEAEALVVRAQELARTVADAVSRLDADPETLQALDDRLSLVQRLKRKYGRGTVAELMAMRDEKASRLSELEGRDAELSRLADAIAAASANVRAAGRSLAAARRKAATALGRAVTKELRALGFLKAGFTVNVAEAEPSEDGCDTVVFLFEPNPGEAARPLASIASSGETARVMLAVKAVVAEHDATPVLVFDEIDANIGGETGRAVGEKLRAVARSRQVIAITHLPQSAVYGDRHFAVAKSVSGGRTRTAVRELKGEERVVEIARMLGGAELSGAAGQHARELLARASVL